MGYEFHITRRTHWADSSTGPAITYPQFKRVVGGDPRFGIDDVVGPRSRVYTARHAVGDTKAPLLSLHKDGDIHAEAYNTPRDLIAIMVEFAGRLKARVVGDFGEEYGPDGRVKPETAFDSPAAKAGVEYFVIEVGGVTQYRYAWCEVPDDGARYSDTSDMCPVCGRPRGRLYWMPPYDIVIKQPRLIPDMMTSFGGADFVVSDRFRRVYESQQLTGITHWLPVNVRAQGTKRTPRRQPGPLWGICLAQSASRLDPDAMAVEWEDPLKGRQCMVCGPDGSPRSVARLVMEGRRKPENDFFYFANMSQGWIASRRAVEAIERAGLTNVSFVPMSRYASRLY